MILRVNKDYFSNCVNNLIVVMVKYYLDKLRLQRVKTRIQEDMYLGRSLILIQQEYVNPLEHTTATGGHVTVPR
jgi:hypothetical protein